MKINSIKNIVAIFMIVLFCVSCSVSAPKWYSKTPVEDGYMFASAMAKSSDEQIAIDKAELDAASKLSGRISSEIDAKLKTVLEENNVDEDGEIVSAFRKEQTQIVDNILKGYVVVNKHTDTEDGKWKAYVLIKWDKTIGDKMIEEEIGKSLLDQVRE